MDNFFASTKALATFLRTLAYILVNVGRDTPMATDAWW